jgi:histone H3/H4
MTVTESLKDPPEDQEGNNNTGEGKMNSETRDNPAASSVEEQGGSQQPVGKKGDEASTSDNEESTSIHAVDDETTSNSIPSSTIDKKDTEEDKNGKKRPASEVIPSKPKKARTGYMIFQDNLREKGLSVVSIILCVTICFNFVCEKFSFFSFVSPFLSQDPGESWLKVVGQKWAAISDEEKETFREMAAKEREQVATLTEERNKAIREAGLDPIDFDDDKDGKDGSKDAASGLVFPVARIRRIAKLDPEVKNLSKEAIHLVVKAAELFTAQLGQETTGVARIQNRRTLLPQDVAHVCRHVSAFTFLKDDIQDLVAQKLKHNEENSADGNAGVKAASKKDAKLEAAAAGSKPLTAYFGASTNK